MLVYINKNSKKIKRKIMPENTKQSYHSGKLHVYGFKRIKDSKNEDSDSDSDSDNEIIIRTDIAKSEIPEESKYNNPDSACSVHFFPFEQCHEVSMDYILSLFKLSEENAQHVSYFRRDYPITLTDFITYKEEESFRESCKKFFPNVKNIYIDKVFNGPPNVLMGTVKDNKDECCVFYAILTDEDMESEFGGCIIDSCWFDHSCTYQEGDGGTREHAYRDENADYLLIDNSGDVSSIVIIEKKRDD